jgi:endonuclease YncB( thermonuclease family)
MGLLRVKGTIDINQFWPTGAGGNVLSDADTVHVKVDPKTSFVFEGNVTHAFDFAWIKTTKNPKDNTRKPDYVVVSQTTSNAHIKIRLQSIDAPELHYRLDQKKPEVRQNWGKRATLELRNFLKDRASGKMTIDCHVETLVNLPNDVFDIYGRFIGDIMIADGSKIVNVNHWLVENGWAFPTFYNSAQFGEIDSIVQLWKKGKGGIRKSIVDRATNDMYGLPAGKAGDNPAQAKTDKGKVILPKMFRRLVGFNENPKAAPTLADYLALPQNKKDLVIDLAAFKKLTPSQRQNPTRKNSGVPLIRLNTLVKDGNRLAPKPETIVFVEKGATLKNNSGPVKGWTAQGIPVAKIK